jgi:hypothetical protein
MDDLQQRAWRNSDAANRSDLFIACYLVQPDSERSGRYRFLHSTLVDFGIAYTTFRKPPEIWPILFGLEHYIGDWLGLQDNPSDHIEQVITLLKEASRIDLTLDVLLSNESRLSEAAFSRVWVEVGRALNKMARKETADRVAARLGMLPLNLRSASIKSGKIFGVESGWSAYSGHVMRVP